MCRAMFSLFSGLRALVHMLSYFHIRLSATDTASLRFF